ncbi:MAG TPA: 50S ribosomal protein L6 [Rhodospirillales bacterium]|jgi:large subunit ribosomal protein L6|nr:50S ribosomal protein L6 [Rhodospirillales bacterium]HJO69379.1 50S ribosomal protein L6 [Rhodospirillales bacterium]
MSRVGQSPIPIPDGVEVNVADDRCTAKGALGERSFTFAEDVTVAVEEGRIVISPRDDSLRARKLWGTTRSLIDSLVTGVAQGFARHLHINGVGYRARMEGEELVLQLGYSHEIRYSALDGVTIQCPEPNRIAVNGPDKQRVGQVAAEIRAFRPPEPYKGKGIKYADEEVLRKEGKKK